MILVWPKVRRQIVILTVTDRDTLIVAFLGQGLSIELDPQEHGLYPDLTHPATAGILLSLWLRWSPQAWMSICRWAETGQPSSVTETHPKKWAITMDLGFYDEDAEGTYLGTALARVLLQTWRKQERLTPLRLDALDPEE
jgi:hypothetical protein